VTVALLVFANLVHFFNFPDAAGLPLELISICLILGSGWRHQNHPEVLIGTVGGVVLLIVGALVVGPTFHTSFLGFRRVDWFHFLLAGSLILFFIALFQIALI
jgi:hypothetical protein